LRRIKKRQGTNRWPPGKRIGDMRLHGKRIEAREHRHPLAHAGHAPFFIAHAVDEEAEPRKIA